MSTINELKDDARELEREALRGELLGSKYGAAGGYFVRWLFDLCDEELLSRLDVCLREVVEAVLGSDDAQGELVLKLGLVKRWERRVEVKPTVSRAVRVEACRRRRMWTDGNGVYAADPAQLELGV